MKIRKMQEKKTFIIECELHNAELECDANELRLESQRTVSYECPICGGRHRVSIRKLQDVTYFKHDVPLTDGSLPVNIMKAVFDEAFKAEKRAKSMYRKMKKTYNALKPQAEERLAAAIHKANPDAGYTEEMMKDSETATNEKDVDGE